MVPKTELSHSLYVCTKCGYHHTIGAYLRLAMLLDSKSFRELDQDLVAPNVLGFPGYEEKLERQRDKTGLMEAVVTARGRVEGRSVAAAALDSRFFMGSMGAAVGGEGDTLRGICPAEQAAPDHLLRQRRGPDAGGDPLPDADGQDQRRHPALPGGGRGCTSPF